MASIVYLPAGRFEILERTVFVGDGEIRMINDSDIGEHPRMDIALHPDQHFRLVEGLSLICPLVTWAKLNFPC